MRLSALFANSLWAAASALPGGRFAGALRRPESIQLQKLHRILAENSSTSFGRLHRFDSIKSYAEFQRTVPIREYSGFEPFINRIASGEPNVLTNSPVTHLVPTSGSSSARKLIPFTPALQAEFNEAIGAWMFDLFRAEPSLLTGRAYWSITPSLAIAESPPSKIPIGFDSDVDYLPAWKRRFANLTMIAPQGAEKVQSLREFQMRTWEQLLNSPDLRLISVWHPSFLLLLLDALPALWPELVAKNPRFKSFDPRDPRSFWPHLRLISCWVDAAAETPCRLLQSRFPNVAIQPKGLVATEAFISLPFANHHPAALTSHFFEFRDPSGEIHLLHELSQDAEYEVIVTTSGGLFRYLLGDKVQVTGFLDRTPSLRFLGRGHSVSDQCGEKLSEQFVATILKKLLNASPVNFAMLAPEKRGSSVRYTLFLDQDSPTISATGLDDALSENPHYQYCRALGQLLPAEILKVPNAYEIYLKHLSKNGARLGDIKPQSLSPQLGWAEVFSQNASHQRPANAAQISSHAS